MHTKSKVPLQWTRSGVLVVPVSCTFLIKIEDTVPSCWLIKSLRVLDSTAKSLKFLQLSLETPLDSLKPPFKPP